MTDIDTTATLLSRVIAIWADVLDADDVESDDNFFDLGGQSLGAIRITAEVREFLTDDVPLGLIFETPILQEYVEALGEFAAS